MELREFKVNGKHKETNRYRTERIQAISEQKCYQVAFECGLPELYEIIEIPLREPTEGQLEYAKKLNLNIPQGASLNDVLTLIDHAVNGDSSEPNTELIEYANAREMIFSKYIGKKALYDVVFDTLTGKDKIAFFLFCVYRWLSDDRFGNLDKHKNKDKFYSLAETLIVDSSFVKSMNRYKGREIRFFGELKYQESNSYHGGSTNIDAFKKASALICNEFNLKSRKTKQVASALQIYREILNNLTGIFTNVVRRIMSIFSRKDD